MPIVNVIVKGTAADHTVKSDELSDEDVVAHMKEIQEAMAVNSRTGLPWLIVPGESIVCAYVSSRKAPPAASMCALNRRAAVTRRSRPTCVYGSCVITHSAAAKICDSQARADLGAEGSERAALDSQCCHKSTSDWSRTWFPTTRAWRTATRLTTSSPQQPMWGKLLDPLT